MDGHANVTHSTKRKLEQAFHSLDAAVGSLDSVDSPPPKRHHTSPSFYTTLAKYGIKFGGPKADQSPYQSVAFAKSTPHLSAILSRAASRTRKALPFRLGNYSASSLSPSSIEEYRPSSISSFLSRLASYKLSTYSSKPPTIDAVAAAKCGWINDGKDRLICGICKSSWVVAGREGMSREAASTLVEKQRVSLVQAHKDGCPWKNRQCDDSIYRIPLKTPGGMLKELKQNALTLQPLLEGTIIKHPLTLKQLHSLQEIIAPLSLSSPFQSDGHQEPSASRPSSPDPEDACPSDNAILTALFGWSIISSAKLEPSRHRTSSSRASSIGPSAVPKATGSHPQREGALSGLTSISMLSLDRSGTLSRENALLYCPLCQRRIGLWAFAPARLERNGEGTEGGSSPTAPPRQNKVPPQRPFDLLKEHRSFCPYVVRSTPLPSLSTVQGSPTGVVSPATIDHQKTLLARTETHGENVEGWRAVLTTVLRYGMKQRMAHNIFDNRAGLHNGDANEPTEVEAVKAMVTGVKSHGGRDLLKYVRTLLG